MRKIKQYILATSMIALLSCSSNSEFTMENSSIDNPILDNGTKTDTTKNDNINKSDTIGGGMGATITDYDDGGTDDITMTPD